MQSSFNLCESALFSSPTRRWLASTFVSAGTPDNEIILNDLLSRIYPDLNVCLSITSTYLRIFYGNWSSKQRARLPWGRSKFQAWPRGLVRDHQISNQDYRKFGHVEEHAMVIHLISSHVANMVAVFNPVPGSLLIKEKLRPSRTSCTLKTIYPPSLVKYDSHSSPVWRRPFQPWVSGSWWSQGICYVSCYFICKFHTLCLYHI